ncbi:tyrosine-type recombinase/integrase [Gordonia iterans]
MATRNRREGVTDSWTKADGSRSSKYGRGKRWLCRWVQEGREYSKSFDKKSEATAFLSDLTTARNTGRFVHDRAGRVTIGDLWQQLADQQAHLSEKTRRNRECAYDVHVEPRWGKVQVGDVQVTAVRAWVADMAKPKPKLNRKGEQVLDEAGEPVLVPVGAATIEYAVGVLRAICELAVDDKRIASNPVVNVKLPRRSHPDRNYLSVEQVDLLAAQVDYLPEVVRFLAFTGLRWGEMAALRVRDFDMLRRRVNISRATSEPGGVVVWGTPKTHEKRSVPFPKAITEDLAGLMAGKGRDDLVFQSRDGEVLRNSTWRPRVWNKALKAAQANSPDFPDVSPHDLRHTAASLAVSAGANVLVVQRMLGHAKASMTLDTYSDLFDGDLDTVAGALDEKIRAARGGAAGPLRDAASE